tara:strand:+ start:45 stop:1718 length:1674 start_codon:yes stop_codon:yes gene_type:complete
MSIKGFTPGDKDDKRTDTIEAQRLGLGLHPVTGEPLNPNRTEEEFKEAQGGLNKAADFLWDVGITAPLFIGSGGNLQSVGTSRAARDALKGKPPSLPTLLNVGINYGPNDGFGGWEPVIDEVLNLDFETFHKQNQGIIPKYSGGKIVQTEAGTLYRAGSLVTDTFYSINDKFVTEGRWQTKYTNKFKNKDILKKYEEAAYNYRVKREVDQNKKNLMKGFTFDNGNPYITDDFGKRYLIVRRPKKVKGEDFKSNKNYTLKSEDDINKALLRNSKYTIGAKDLRILKQKINKGELTLLDDKRFYDPLMEHGVGYGKSKNKAYLEHKIAKGEDWFWKLLQENPEIQSWVNLNLPNGPELIEHGRNSEFNLRILFNKDYKELKDGVETVVKKLNYGKDPIDRFIITIEDPQAQGGSDNFARMSNPGNITVIRVSDGKEVGKIPDYLMYLYSDEFASKWDKLKDNLKHVPGINNVPEFYRLKESKKIVKGNEIIVYNETFKEWRQRVINERLGLIKDKSHDTDDLRIGEHIIDDRTEFFDIFNTRTDWISTPPTHVEEDKKK